MYPCKVGRYNRWEPALLEEQLSTRQDTLHTASQQPLPAVAGTDTSSMGLPLRTK